MANETIINPKDKDRPYSCPKCGGEVAIRGYYHKVLFFRLDPVTGDEKETGEREGLDHDESVYYCTSERCGWEAWEDDLSKACRIVYVDQQLPESICGDGSIAIPSQM